MKDQASISQGEALRICTVNVPASVEKALSDQGHSILSLRPEPGESPYLPEILEREGFQADALLQTETLNDRVLLGGLGELDCVKAYWAVDPHLNAYWHAAYGRLFDVLFSTQRRWISDLKRYGAANVVWLPWYGHALPWTPWAKRDVGLCFVGRVTPERPLRGRFVELLHKGFPESFQHLDGLDTASMYKLYVRTRIVPNESILGEVNFRLFEAVTCGCLVIGQALGPDQDELFEPGKETLVYEHSLELSSLLERFTKREAQAVAVARAGWERLQAEHLPAHRAKRIADVLRQTPRTAVKGPEAHKWLALAACQLWRGGRLEFDLEHALSLLESRQDDPESSALCLRVLVESGQRDKAEQLLRRLLSSGCLAGELEVDAAASLAALRMGDWDGAKAFWYRHEQATQTAHPRKPASPFELYRLWAALFRAQERIINCGLVFDENRQVPSTALECLAAALALEPENLDLIRQMDGLLARLPGQEQARLGFLSLLTLHRPKDWRLGLEAGLTNLRAYRTKQGLEELRLARKLAMEQEQELRFCRALINRDPSGLLLPALADQK
ncbi:MAG: glycosyltransferase [Desulfovibrionaceae bacterium]